MNTKTAEMTEDPAAMGADMPIADVAQSQGQVAVFKQPRLPWHDAIHERFPSVDKSAWKALVEAVYPNAKSVDSVVMALAYCKARNLDPFKRPVHIVPMYDTQSGGYIETVWPGISELRTTAFRTGQYAGCEAMEFGPMIEQDFTGEKWINKVKQAVTIKVKFPEWARLTIYRIVHGASCKFVGPKVLWLESYATVGKSDLPNDMWRERPEGQLEKCGEAAALRRAFPEEIGNEYAAEEMEGRRKFVDLAEAAKNVTPAAAGQPASIAQASAAAATAAPIEAGEATTTSRPPSVDLGGTPAAKTTAKQATKEPEKPTGKPPALDGEVLPPETKRPPTTSAEIIAKDEAFLAMVHKVLGTVKLAEDLEETFNDHIAARMDEVSKGRQPDVYAIYQEYERKLGMD